MKVTIGVSNRHVHLTKETYFALFGKDFLEKRNDLNQIGEFASIDTVSLQYDGKTIENVRIIGPFRNYNQVELLKSDLNFFGIDAPIRKSGDLINTPGITLKHEDKSVLLDSGVICAERHLHVPTKESLNLGLFERDKVILSNGDVTFDAFVKVSDNAYFEVHIDKDEALEYGLKNGDEVELSHV